MEKLALKGGSLAIFYAKKTHFFTPKMHFFTPKMHLVYAKKGVKKVFDVNKGALF